MKLAPVIIKEAKRLKIPIPDENFDSSGFQGITTTEMLKVNIDDDNKDLQKKNIVKIASEFLSISGNFDQFRFYDPYDAKEILSIVPQVINEVEVRRFEMVFHILHSSFVLFVIHGVSRLGNR